MVVHICTKFNENILDSIKIIEWTQLSYEKFQRGIKNVGEVSILILCTLSDGGLYLYKVS